MPEILASLDDINANLPSEDQGATVVATDANTGLLQVSVARVVRGYLRYVIDQPVLLSWDTPASTPDLVREIAAKFIASQLFFNETAKSSLDIGPDSFAQKRYDEAMALLNGIVAGNIILDDVVIIGTGILTDLDFFPVDTTNRAFSMGMIL